MIYYKGSLKPKRFIRHDYIVRSLQAMLHIQACFHVNGDRIVIGSRRDCRVACIWGSLNINRMQYLPNKIEKATQRYDGTPIQNDAITNTSVAHPPIGYSQYHVLVYDQMMFFDSHEKIITYLQLSLFQKCNIC